MKLREAYDRSEEVDEAVNANFVSSVIPNAPALTREEDDLKRKRN
mgnify:CR=1 FL=1